MQQVIYSAMPYCIAQRADRIARLYIMSDVLSQLQSLRRRLETQYRTKTQPKKIKKSSIVFSFVLQSADGWYAEVLFS